MLGTLAETLAKAFWEFEDAMLTGPILNIGAHNHVIFETNMEDFLRMFL